MRTVAANRVMLGRSIGMLLILQTWVNPIHAIEELSLPSHELHKDQIELVSINSLGNLQESHLSNIDGSLSPTSYSRVLGNMYFDEERYLLRGDAAALIEAIVQELKTETKWGLHMEAYCDERGTEAYNIVLGDRQMRLVTDFVLDLGVEPHRLWTTSYGQEKPQCLVSAKNCWEENLPIQLGFQVPAPRHSTLGCLVRFRLITREDPQPAFHHLGHSSYLQPLRLVAIPAPAERIELRRQSATSN